MAVAFEKGLAQGLMEMQAYQWQNQQAGRQIEVYGIVTNGRTWPFYRMTPTGAAYEPPSIPLGIGICLQGVELNRSSRNP